MISSIKDVDAFFKYIISERRVNFHPDDGFENYISLENGEPSFSNEEIIQFNTMLDEAFRICEENGVDIYEIGLKEQINFIQNGKKEEQ